MFSLWSKLRINKNSGKNSKEMSKVLLLKRDGSQEDGSVGQKYLLQN